ncbi:class I SAM-dependent methyltransferase [Gaetbulibacter jejuensis]|uniref:Methyltransferase family protein n=1 Tax=Gaetbulibacter jejuensis TaxID=584607 RepID=A0ABN1JW58_9FLAO
MEKNKIKYIHTEEIHNLSAPMEIVPKIIEIIKPNNVVDVGCGVGTFLYCFKQEGVKEVLGIDGEWVDRELLKKYLDENEFLIRNLEEEFELEKKYDLVVSLEVAEHISEKAADNFIKNLINAGEIILFSAAIPYQGGQNHINEQWLSYWENKFIEHDYVIHDILRPLFWNNAEIPVWYKQNMVVATPKKFQFDSETVYNPLRDVVHYSLFSYRNIRLNKIIEEKNKKLNEIYGGELKKSVYLKFFLKSIIGKRCVESIKSLLNLKRKV